MKNVLIFLQIIVSVLLAITILLQNKGGGLGFGDASEQYRSRRGVEKLLYRATVILAVIFCITSIGNLLV